MGETAYTQVLNSGTTTPVPGTPQVDSYTLQTRGRRDLITLLNVTAGGNGDAFLDEPTAGAALPITVTSSNQNFKYGTSTYVVATGTYTTLTALAAAVGGALTGGTTALSTLVSVTVDEAGTGLLFVDKTSGAVTTAFTDGASDDFWNAGLGLTSGDALGGSLANTDFSVTVTIWGHDSVSGKKWEILSGAAVTSINTLNALRVSPVCAAVSNAVASDILPNTVIVEVTFNDDNPATYTLVAQLI